jgi:hypothetical protein
VPPNGGIGAARDLAISLDYFGKATFAALCASRPVAPGCGTFATSSPVTGFQDGIDKRLVRSPATTPRSVNGVVSVQHPTLTSAESLSYKTSFQNCQPFIYDLV